MCSIRTFPSFSAVTCALLLNADTDCYDKPKMTYAASKDAIRRALNGVAAEIQANDEDEIEHGTVIDKVRKGTR